MTMGFSTRMTPPHDWRWVMSRVVSSGRPDERNARTDHRQPTRHRRVPGDPPRACPGLSERAVNVGRVSGSGSAGPGTRAVQGTFDDLGTPLPDVTFVVVDLETTGGSPADSASPRSARSRSAAARCSASSRRWSTRPSRSRAFIQVAHRHHRRRWSRDAPRIESALPGVPRVRPRRVLVAHNAGFDVGVPQDGGAVAPGIEWPRLAVLDTVHLARQLVMPDESRNHKLSTPGRRCSARRPRPTTARCTTPARPSTSCTASSTGSATSASTPSRSSRATPRGSPRPAPQAVPRRRACRTLPGVYLFKDERRPGPLRRHVAQHPHPRAQPTSPPPSSAPGWPRWCGSPERASPIVCQTTLEARSASCASSPSTSRATTAGPRTPSGPSGSS